MTGFELLLRCLDEDPERAGVAYEGLRRRLAGLLHWWGAADGDELADIAIDRVARRLEEGVAIPASALTAYARRTARLVFSEYVRRDRRRQLRTHDVVVSLQPQEPQAALDMLDQCLDGLPAAERQMVLGYYADGRHADNRRRLAAAHGISLTALRIRAHRIRERLEHDMRAAMARSERTGATDSTQMVPAFNAPANMPAMAKAIALHGGRGL